MTCRIHLSPPPILTQLLHPLQPRCSPSYMYAVDPHGFLENSLLTEPSLGSLPPPSHTQTHTKMDSLQSSILYSHIITTFTTCSEQNFDSFFIPFLIPIILLPVSPLLVNTVRTWWLLTSSTTMVSWEAGFSRETEPIPDTDSCPIHMPCALYGIGSFIYGSPKSFTQKTGDQENVTIQFQTFPEGRRSTGANRGALVWAYIQNQGDFKVSFQRQADKGIGPWGFCLIQAFRSWCKDQLHWGEQFALLKLPIQI